MILDAVRIKIFNDIGYGDQEVLIESGVALIGRSNAYAVVGVDFVIQTGERSKGSVFIDGEKLVHSWFGIGQVPFVGQVAFHLHPLEGS